jgi:hypothetical protein
VARPLMEAKTIANGRVGQVGEIRTKGRPAWPSAPKSQALAFTTTANPGGSIASPLAQIEKSRHCEELMGIVGHWETMDYHAASASLSVSRAYRTATL